MQNSIWFDGNNFSFNIPSSSVGSKGSNNNFRFDCKNSWDENMCEYRRYILSIVVCEISFVWRLSHGWSAAYIFRRTFSSPGESAAKLLLYKSSRKWKGIKSLFQLFSCSSTFNSTRSWKLHSRNVKSRVEPTIKVNLIYGTLRLQLCCKKAQLKSFFAGNHKFRLNHKKKFKRHNIRIKTKYAENFMNFQQQILITKWKRKENSERKLQWKSFGEF